MIIHEKDPSFLKFKFGDKLAITYLLRMENLILTSTGMTKEKDFLCFLDF